MAKILASLKDDKSTLAKCMRVSTTFNCLAAPILYKTIRLGKDEPDCHPLVRHQREGPLDGSLSESDNLRHVKHLVVTQHQSYPCHGAVATCHSPFAVLIKIPGLSLRFNLYAPKSGAQETSSVPLILTMNDYMFACPVLRRFSGDKLILFGASCSVPLLPAFKNLSKVNKFVAVITWRTGSLPWHHGFGQLELPRQSPLDQLVLIAWREHPREFEHRGDQLDICFDALKGIMVSVISLARRHIAKKYIIVNGGPKAQALFQDWRGRLGPKANADLVEFLTMEQYLARNDWEGVFTEEEAQPWLDDPFDEDWPGV